MTDQQNFFRSRASVPLALLILALACTDALAQSFYRGASSAATGEAYDSQNTAWTHPTRAPQVIPGQIRQVTNLAPLHPPREIFSKTDQPPAHGVNETIAGWTHQPTAGSAKKISETPSVAQPTRFMADGRFDNARALNPNSISQTFDVNEERGDTGGGELLQSINALVDSNRPAFAPTDFETEVSRSDFEAITSTASDTLGDVTGWVGQKAKAMFGGATDGRWQQRLSQMFGGADVKKIIGGLATVIGGYLGLVWLLKIINPGASGAIPSEVLEVVGSAPLNNKQNLQLIRLGSKLLLMMHSPEGTQPIGEVNDPAEVQELLALCGGRGRSVSPAIRAAIENSTDHSSESYKPNPSVSPATSTASHSDSANLNQLLNALEKYQSQRHSRGRLFEA